MTGLLGATEIREIQYGLSMILIGIGFGAGLTHLHEVAAVTAGGPWILVGLYILSGAAKR